MSSSNPTEAPWCWPPPTTMLSPVAMSDTAVKNVVGLPQGYADGIKQQLARYTALREKQEWKLELLRRAAAVRVDCKKFHTRRYTPDQHRDPTREVSLLKVKFYSQTNRPKCNFYVHPDRAPYHPKWEELGLEPGKRVAVECGRESLHSDRYLECFFEEACLGLKEHPGKPIIICELCAWYDTSINANIRWNQLLDGTSLDDCPTVPTVVLPWKDELPGGGASNA
ncbi:hypothetical protein BJ508DRAFT_331202 [Ascobolus immersus RN42]|uniref:Uncharacterized protein n=1 Tax=Ascobolus immersus RN42 TaxID=1160509 RepID=A0A3N4HSS3_ASCIM|nr:hypothetical protein BJ508DRAFT_331202 [Ascobolus immersus RN42]